jgi:tRNA threonylcarbamoyladenosine biosynthesis protein TsaE
MNSNQGLIPKKTIQSVEEMNDFAKQFISQLKPYVSGATVVGMYGDLGAGKTTCTQFFAQALGITETVVSPTFVIEKIYELSGQAFTHFIHIDAYRLEKSSEMLHLGWAEIISNKENLIIVEWPERIADIMPPHIQIRLKWVSENEREVEVKNIS